MKTNECCKGIRHPYTETPDIKVVDINISSFMQGASPLHVSDEIATTEGGMETKDRNDKYYYEDELWSKNGLW